MSEKYIKIEDGKEVVYEKGIFGDRRIGELHENLDGSKETRPDFYDQLGSFITGETPGHIRVERPQFSHPERRAVVNGQEGTFRKDFWDNTVFVPDKPRPEANKGVRDEHGTSPEHYDSSSNGDSTIDTIVRKETAEEVRQPGETLQKKPVYDPYNPYHNYTPDYLKSFSKMKQGDKLLELVLIQDQATLRYIVQKDPDPLIRITAMGGLEDNGLLLYIACYDPDPDVRYRAFVRSTDPSRFDYMLLLKNPDAEIRDYAFNQISDTATLIRIADGAQQPDIREEVCRRLGMPKNHVLRFFYRWLILPKM